MKIWYFLQMFWKDSPSKKIALKYDLSCCIIWKDDISFSRNIILFFRRKIKDDLSQKNAWKYNIFFKCRKKMVCKKDRAETWSFLYYLERWYFLATSKTWDRTLDPDPEKPGPSKTWTLKNLDPEKHGINIGLKNCLILASNVL